MPSLDWDVTNPDSLTIIGAIVQREPDGPSYPFTIFRGNYDDITIYYKGDYLNFGGSSWHYINDIPTAGIIPTEGAFWTCLASGTVGAHGTSPIGIFRGEYSEQTDYCGAPFRLDIVYYSPTQLYYMARPDAGNPFRGIAPTDADYWNEFEGNFETVATSLLFAELAYINTLGVRHFQGIPVVPGDLSGSVVNTQGAIMGVNKIVSFTLTESTANGEVDIVIRGLYRRMVFNITLANTVTQFINNYYSDYLGVGVTLTWDGAILYAEGTDGEDIIDQEYITRVPNISIAVGIYQEYSSGQKRIDTVTLTGVGGAANLKCNALVRTAIWMGSLTATAIAFAQAYNHAYSEDGVLVSAIGNDIIFTSKNKGFDFSGETLIEPPLNSFYGAISIDGNEIWEDKINSGKDAGIAINMKGYKGGTDYARQLIVGNGKGEVVFSAGGDPITGQRFVTINAPEIYFFNLPTSPAGLEKDMVWVDANGFLKIVL